MIINQFLKEVRRYCSLIEDAHKISLEEFLVQLSIILPLIYSYGKELPILKVKNEGINDRKIYDYSKEIADKLGNKNIYNEVFDPLTDKKPIKTTLSDDLADIYRGLKGPLTEYENDNNEDTIWEWKFEIQGHTGDHLVDALRVIHRLTNPYYCDSL